MSKASESVAKPLIGFTVFAVVALLLTYIILSTLERSVPGDLNSYTTYFNDASGLSEGDDVRMAGVRVGRVDSIERDGSRAKVTFDLQTDQTIFTNTKSAIRYQNLIGQRYIALSLVEGEDSAPMDPGSELRMESEDSFDVTQLLSGFQPVFETLTPEQVNELSQGLIEALQGNSTSLSRTVAEVGQLANDMADRDEVIGVIISNLSGVMRDLAQQGDQVGSLINSISELIENLNSNSAAFGQSISQIGETAAGFADVLTDSRADLQAAGTSARNATQALIGVGPQLDGTARNLPILLGHFAQVLGEGAYLNIYACDLDIAIGDVLFPPGLINQIGGSQHSVVCR